MSTKYNQPGNRFGDGPLRGRFHLRDRCLWLAWSLLNQMMVIVRDITVGTIIVDYAETIQFH